MTEKIRILIADDHAVVRAGIRLLLNTQQDMEVVGEAENGHEALKLVQEFMPDVVLMDISMPNVDGIEATSKIKQVFPEARILALTMHEDARYFFQVLRAGALGYILKGDDPEQLLFAIRSVYRDKAYLIPDLAQKLLDDYLSRLKEGEEQDTYDTLTAREKEVLKLIGDGYSGREISEKLFLSINTVERHRTNLMDKLGMHNKSQLIKFAIRKGLVNLDS